MGDATVPYTPSGTKAGGCGPRLWKPSPIGRGEDEGDMDRINNHFSI